MSLTDQLNAPPPARIHGSPCSIGALRQGLPTDEAVALDKMLWELGWRAPQVHAALSAEGHEVGLQTIGRHRRQQCRCFTQARP